MEISIQDSPQTALRQGQQSSCQVCYKRLNFGASSMTQTLFYELQVTVDKGCIFCANIQAAIRAWGICPEQHLEKGYIMWMSNDTSRPLLFMLNMAENEQIIEIFTDNCDHYPVFGSGRTPDRDASSTSTFDLVKSWLQTCLKTHKLCVKSSPDTQVGPARLLDIGIGPDNGGIKLVEVGATIPEYFTLSYCWGGKEFLKTQSKTLDQWKENIPWELLPRTFQDVISITRKLGYQHLWIDSLCIIQDSIVDWQTESSKMADVYEHGLLSISAGYASTPEYGCFHDRYDVAEQLQIPVESYVKSFVAQTTCDGPTLALFGGLTVTMNTFHIWNNTLHIRMPNFIHSQDGHGYSKKGLLAPRIIDYTLLEIVWECSMAPGCECCSYRDDFNRINRRRLREIPQQRDYDVGVLTGKARCDELGWCSRDSFDAHFKVWERLVADYSLRELSHSSDKLPAISGVAKRYFQPQLGAYLAGLWEAQLPEGLLWVRSRYAHPLVQPSRKTTKIYRAPSWSWASIDER